MSLLGSNFKASAVNMGKVSFDSTSTIKGMIFQFLVALKRCFEMQEGQSVYIERFGDVSVIDKEDAIQIESNIANEICLIWTRMYGIVSQIGQTLLFL